MALQPRIIACGAYLAALGMLMRFLVGPAFMTIASYASGLRGTVFHVSIVQVWLLAILQNNSTSLKNVF